MLSKQFTEDGEWRPGISYEDRGALLTFSYDGDLGGGTLKFFSVATVDGVDKRIPVPDGELSATTLDGQGNARQIVRFATKGLILVELSGSTNPDFAGIIQ